MVGSMSRKVRKKPDLLWLVILMGLYASLLILPVQRFELPFNTALVDFVNVLAVPLFWLYFMRQNQPVRFPYAPAMWLIFFASMLSTFAAPDHWDSLTLIGKEVYLYVWFVTLVALLSNFGSSGMQRVYLIWLIAALLNGAFIVAQFAFPEFLQESTAYLDKYDAYGSPRPLGLFKNPNIAADFQMLAFVPLFLLQMSSVWLIILAVFMVATVIATGSLGVSLALVGGALVAFIFTQIIRNQNQFSVGFYVRLIGLLLMGAILIAVALNQFPNLTARIDYIYYSRFGRSAENRLVLWEQGADVLIEQISVFGIGPNAFKDDVLGGKGLHNDIFSFLVERGLFGLFGLMVFGVMIVRDFFKAFRAEGRSEFDTRALIILAAMLVAVLIESQTHQVFHFRSLWLVLAVAKVTVNRIVYPETIMAPYEAESKLLPGYETV